MEKVKFYYTSDQEMEEILKGPAHPAFPWLRKFPFEVSISHDNIRLGTLTLDFEYKKEKISREKNWRKRILLVRLLDEVRNFVPIFKENIELVFKMYDKYKKRRNHLLRFDLQEWPPTKRHHSLFHRFFYFKEDEIFEMIKQEGPYTLCNSDIQEMINLWLLDKDRAFEKMTKLRDSLLEYAFGPSVLSKKFKPGRPKAEIIEKIGTSRITEVYREITQALVIVKAYRENYPPDNISEMFEQAYRDWLFSYKEKLEKRKDKIYKKINIKELRAYCDFLNMHKDYKVFEYITDSIEKDKYLRAEFETFRWEPNKFAKKIMATLLDVSVSKIEKILYRQV